MFPKTTQDIPVLACIKKITKHLSIVSIKNLMQTTSSKSLLNLKVERNFLQKSELQKSFPTKWYTRGNIKRKQWHLLICIPLYFNNSLFGNRFPKYLWKADITPVFKKDKTILKTSYRPVSILAIVSKIYERCLYNQINYYSQPSFSKLQYGSCKGHSEQHWLLVLIEKCSKVLDKWGFAGLLLTDLSKAFDWIDHELLTAMLHACGFNIKSLELIQRPNQKS